MDQEHEQTAVKPGYWAVLPADVRYDPDLPASAKLLYAEISSLTNQVGYCFAKNSYFQELYGMSDRTVRRLISALESAGYIRITDGDGGHARRKIFAGINPMSANPDRNDGVSQGVKQDNPDISDRVSAEPGQKWPGNPDKNVGVLCNNKKYNNHSPQGPQGGGGDPIWDPEAFERFWKLYPKKRDKAKAIREWNRLKADRKLMRKMSAALGAQMASEEWQRDNGRAIPYPCRWLSHRRWEDELTVAMPAPAPREEAVEWI